MHLRTDDHLDRRRAKHSIGGDIPSRACKKRITCCRQCSEIRCRGTSNQASGAIGRQSKCFTNPPNRHFLQFRRDWRHHSQRRILVPRRSQPIGSHRRGNHSAVHEAEVTPAGRSHGGCGANFVESFDHVTWVA